VKKTFLAVLLSFATSTWLAAAQLSVSGHGSTITVVEAGKRHRIPLPDAVRVDMDDAVLLARQSANGFQYLVFFVTGPSRRGGNGMGHCGAGIESSIVWLQLQDWRVTDSKHRQVESCWRDITLLQPAHWKDGICIVTFWDFRDNNQEFTLRYNPKKPAEGFQLTSKPFN
jgi:hypothetical protein